MNNNILPYAMLWGVLAIADVCRIVYRRSVAIHEDDSIHLEGTVSTQQATVAHKLAVIDVWGKAQGAAPKPAAPRPRRYR